MTAPTRRLDARTPSARARAVFNRRRIGRAVTIAAVVAAVTCVIGAVVAWQLLGDLRTRSAASLDLLERTLTNVDESLAIAQDVTSTVGDSLDTIRDSLTTLSAGVERRRGSAGLGRRPDRGRPAGARPARRHARRPA